MGRVVVMERPGGEYDGCGRGVMVTASGSSRVRASSFWKKLVLCLNLEGSPCEGRRAAGVVPRSDARLRDSHDERFPVGLDPGHISVLSRDDSHPLSDFEPTWQRRASPLHAWRRPVSTWNFKCACKRGK